MEYTMERWREFIPLSLVERYEFHNFNSAIEILTRSFPEEFAQITEALEHFTITTADITEKGGNESNIPKRLSSHLRPLGWRELEISGDLVVRLLEGKKRKEIAREFVLNDFVSGIKSTM